MRNRCFFTLGLYYEYKLGLKLKDNDFFKLVEFTIVKSALFGITFFSVPTVLTFAVGFLYGDPG